MAEGGLPRYLTFDREGLLCLADMVELADDCARSSIECNVPYERDADGHPWYDLTRIADEDLDSLLQAVQYLEQRGKLTRREDAPTWVQPWPTRVIA